MSAKKTNFNPEQQRIIDADGRILVSASAGTGKTTVMVQKIVDLIKSGVPLGKILVLVYNNAAASEIREKIAKRLFEASSETTGSQREFLIRQLDEIMLAEIKTVHAFCMDLLREHFEPSELNPNFEILSDREKQGMSRRAMQDVLNEYNLSDDGLFRKLSAAFDPRKQEPLSLAVVTLNSQADIQYSPEDFLAAAVANAKEYENGGAGRFVLENLKNKCRRYLSELERYLACVINPSTLSVVLRSAAQIASAVIGVTGFCELPKALSTAVFDYNARVKYKDGGLDEGDLEACRSLLYAFRDDYRGWCDLFLDYSKFREAGDQCALFTEKLVEIVLKYRAALQLYKKNARKLGFNDLEHKAVELLDSFGEEIQNRFPHVFVDEYQDFNPIQEYIVSRLLSKDAFFVGDVKQSIYGFRLACPEIFLERYREYKKCGQAFPLSTNYRSCPAILNFVNSVFSKVMKADNSGIDYAKEGNFLVENESMKTAVSVVLFAEEKAEKQKGTPVLVANTPYSVLEHPAKASSEMLSSAAAQGIYIAEEIRKSMLSAEREGKPLRYGDFAVLYRGFGTSEQKIVDALRAQGIPVDAPAAGSAKGFGEEGEIINLLRAVDNPCQDIPFVGFLLSPFCGYGSLTPFDEVELYDVRKWFEQRLAADTLPESLKQNDGKLSFFQLMQAYDGQFRAKTEAALKRFETIRFRSGYKNVFSLVTGVMSDCGYEAFVLSRPDGKSGLAAVSALLEKMEGSGASSVTAFLDYYGKTRIERSTSGDERPERAKSAGVPSPDKVLFTTIHASKGLEYEVVFVVDISSTLKLVNNSDYVVENAVMSGYGELFGIKYYDSATKLKLDNVGIVAARILQEERGRREEMRLLYVAMTRAKRKLYLTGEYKDGSYPELSYLDYMYPALNGDASSVLQLHSAEEMRVYMKNTVAPAHTHTYADKYIFEKAINNVINYQYKYAEAASMPTKFSVSRLNEEGNTDAVFEKQRVFSEEDEMPDRRIIGTAYHAVLENIPFSLSTEEEVEAAISLLVDSKKLSAEDAEVVSASVVLQCLQSELIRHAANNVCMREIPFVLYVPANEVRDTSVTDKVLVQGVIDLIIDDGELTIVDYKASLRNIDYLRKTYKKQLELYKMAVKVAVGRDVSHIALFSILDGTTVYLD